jgi:hypothetical protein
MRNLLNGFLAAAMIAVPLTANAQAVTYEFTGAVTSVFGSDYESVPIGTPVSGTYTFDPAAADPTISRGSIGSYSSIWFVQNEGGPAVNKPFPSTLVFSQTVIGPGISYETPAIGGTASSSGFGGQNQTDSNLPPDSFSAEEHHDFAPYQYSDSYLNLGGSTAPYAANGLPVLSLANDYASGEFVIDDTDGLTYNITSLTPVPLPADALLMLGGLGGLGVVGRKRRTH